MNVRAYNAAIKRGDLETVRLMDAAEDAAFNLNHPERVAIAARFADAAFERQERARCWDDGDISTVQHDPR
jgi:hypothetical protein